MNLSAHPTYSYQEKHDFYASAARRFKAELRLYGAHVAIHLENKNDEVFWRKVLHHAAPELRVRFLSGTRSIGGNVTNGCTQCLQYLPFLDERLWIAIDSDYRYLNEECVVRNAHYVLQTYTYSFENHFCYYENAQRAADTPSERAPRQEQSFSFRNFFESYSRIVYPLMVWQLYLQGVNPEAFPKNLFHRLLSLPVGPKALENDGASVLLLLKERVHKMLAHFRRTYPDADTTWYEARMNALGVTRSNCYLYVRGHQLYDMLILIGRRLTHDFEKHLLAGLCYDYPEIQAIISDIHKSQAPAFSSQGLR